MQLFYDVLRIFQGLPVSAKQTIPEETPLQSGFISQSILLFAKKVKQVY